MMEDAKKNVRIFPVVGQDLRLFAAYSVWKWTMILMIAKSSIVLSKKKLI